jgi:hypothetical protein
MRTSSASFVALKVAMGVAAATVALGGCAVYGQPVGYVGVTSAPYDVYGYPSTYYEGRTVYLVGDRWMYNDGGRWLYYVHEPPFLYRQRDSYRWPGYSTYPRYAPPAYAPPAYGQPAYRPPAHAPPATRSHAPPAAAPRAPAQPRVGPMPGARPPVSAPPAPPSAPRAR